ncbi:MAG: hypothetical protein KGM24_11850, partial [Elusimicrobia bacterium]|nr:hypothetical protein [Elusimicrobiota bacterium]
QVALPFPITSGYDSAGAIDKKDQLVYISKYYFIQKCIDPFGGCPTPPYGTTGSVYEFDFQGNFLRTITLPGNSAANGSCWQPQVMTVDGQGDLDVADPDCRHLLRYGSNGAMLNDDAIGGDFTPYAIWADSLGNVYSNQYICSTTACLPGLSKYAPDGTALARTVIDSQISSYWMGVLYDGCAWDDRIVYMGSNGAPPLRRYVLDNPPNVPAQEAPIGLTVQHSSSAALSWQQGGDPDGDGVRYTAYLGSSSGALSPVGQTDMASIQSQTLDFGATYFWQVSAQDYYLGLPLMVTSAPVVSFNLSLLNNPPGAFETLTGSGPVVTRSTTAVLSWGTSTDPDGDAVTYSLAVGTAPDSATVVQDSSATSYGLAFQFGTTYYWQVTAQDGLGGDTTTQVQTFVASILDTPPGVPSLNAPFMNAPTVATMRGGVSVTWGKVTNDQGDPIAYTAYLGESPSALDAVATVAQSSATSGVGALASSSVTRPASAVQDLGASVSLSLSGLDYYKTYYFQLAARTPYGDTTTTPLQSFTLTPTGNFPKAYNYPNPFSPDRGGTNIVLDAPPSGYAGARLTVYSEFGSKLCERDLGPVRPGVSQYAFDGHCGAGSLMNGSYVGRVRFEGPSDSATFFLLVVR